METITKLDANTIKISSDVVEQQGYNGLLERRDKLVKDMADNVALETANRAVNTEALAKVNFQISEADKLGVVEKVEPIVEPVVTK